MRVIKELLERNLISNYENIKKSYPNVKKIYAVVKAEAYGNGAKGVVNALKKYDEVHFVVANTQEAKDVKMLSPEKEILIVGGVDKTCFEDVIYNDYILGISKKEEVNEITNFFENIRKNDHNKYANKKMQVHLKINTGMSRLGFDVFDEVEFKNVLKEILTNECIDVKGMYSHLSETDNLEILKVEEERFDKAISLLNEVLGELEIEKKIDDITLHLLASAGILNGEIKAYDAIRPGIALYGYYSSFDLKEKWESKHEKLRPTVRVKSRLNLVREVKKDEYISYISTYKAKENMKVGIVESGYDDGYIRAFSNKARVKVNGKFTKVLGIVCMNLFMVDLTNIDAKEGDEVILLDEEIDAEELASIAGTITDEILCNFK